jgi:hypothetical protein
MRASQAAISLYVFLCACEVLLEWTADAIVTQDQSKQVSVAFRCCCSSLPRKCRPCVTAVAVSKHAHQSATMSCCCRYHQYKFIVDGKWMHDETAPYMPDPLGNVNNWLFVRKIDPPTAQPG